MTSCGRQSAVAAAVVVFLLSDVIGSSQWQKCTDNGCCLNNKISLESTRITCNVSAPSSGIHLRNFAKLEEFKITQGNKIVMESDAVANTNNSLHSLLFYDIQELTLKANSKVQVRADRAVTLTVRRVGTLHIKTSAFLGWQSALATVSIADTESVHIDQDAFPAGSSFRRVRLFNITSLTMETGAIRGAVGQLELDNIHSLQLRQSAINGTVVTLSLRNITAESCPPSAIGGSIDFVALHSVTLSSLESRCLDAGLGWQRLTLTDSNLGYLSPRSIHGTVDDITISGCEITSAGPAAINVTVGRLNLTTSAVSELGPRALQVRATSSVALRRVSVTYLRPDALSGLQVNDTTGGGISVSRLSVDHAEPGSLRFADGASVTLKDLLLPGGCVCSTPSWARQLLLGASGGDEAGPSGDEGGPFPDGEDGLSGGDRDSHSSGNDLATERDTLLRQVEAGLCTACDGVHISLSDFTAQYCGHAGGVSGQPTGRSAPLAGWWFHLAVVALVALLLAVAVLLVIAAGRYRRHRQRKRSERPEPAGTALEGLCSPDGPIDVAKQHEDSRFCRLGLPSGPAEPEELYSDVGTQELYSDVASQELYSDVGTQELYSDVGTQELYSDVATQELYSDVATQELYSDVATQELYSDVAYHVYDGRQRTDKSPPAGRSQQEAIYANSP